MSEGALGGDMVEVKKLKEMGENAEAVNNFHKALLCYKKCLPIIWKV